MCGITMGRKAYLVTSGICEAEKGSKVKKLKKVSIRLIISRMSNSGAFLGD